MCYPLICSQEPSAGQRGDGPDGVQFPRAVPTCIYEMRLPTTSFCMVFSKMIEQQAVFSRIRR